MKHPVPKRKTSRSRGKIRHSAWATALAKFWENKTHIHKCPDCSQPKLMHNVCSNCGMYKGKQMTSQKEDNSKVKVVKV